MQCDPSRVDNNTQHPPVNEPLYGTENGCPSYPQPPSYTQCSEQSISDIRYTASNAQNYDQTSMFQQEDTLVVPASGSLTLRGPLLIITSKFRAFFLCSGIGFLLVGAGAIGLELSIIMYASSTYYRGFWTGSIMIGGGISMFMVIYRVSHPIIYTIKLLTCVLISNSIGVGLSVLEITGAQACIDEKYSRLCDREIGNILKLISIGVINFAGLYTLTVLSYAWHIKTKLSPKPPDSGTPCTEY